MAPRVLVDANVLYRTRLRELLLALTRTGVIEPVWSERILEEAAHGLVRNGALDVAEREAWIKHLSAPAYLIAARPATAIFGLPDPDDEHVLAAALDAGAGTILTFNTRDFPPRILRPMGVTALMPDAYLLALIVQVREPFLSAVDAARLANAPAVSVEGYLAMLRRAGLSRTVKQITGLI